jgi:radical SAM superfamily enzyme
LIVTLAQGIVYNLLPDSGDREGRVGLLLNGDYEQIKNNASAIEAHLQHHVSTLAKDEHDHVPSRSLIGMWNSQVFKNLMTTSTDVKVDTVHLVQDSKLVAAWNSRSLFVLTLDVRVEVLFQILDSNNKPVAASAIDKHLASVYKSTSAAPKL